MCQYIGWQYWIVFVVIVDLVVIVVQGVLFYYVGVGIEGQFVGVVLGEFFVQWLCLVLVLDWYFYQFVVQFVFQFGGYFVYGFVVGMVVQLLWCEDDVGMV